MYYCKHHQFYFVTLPLDELRLENDLYCLHPRQEDTKRKIEKIFSLKIFNISHLISHLSVIYSYVYPKLSKKQKKFLSRPFVAQPTK